jgi:hypothetical protein
MPALANGFAIVLDQLEFEVIHNRTDVSFLTSDNPVVYFAPTVPDAKVLPYRVRPPHGEIELLFPIDADTVVRGRTGPAGPRYVALSDRQFAKRINRFVARFGHRFVFSRDKTHEALIIKHAGTSPITKTINMTSPTGEAFVLSECVFGTRPTKPKWTT